MSGWESERTPRKKEVQHIVVAKRGGDLGYRESLSMGLRDLSEGTKEERHVIMNGLSNWVNIRGEIHWV